MNAAYAAYLGIYCTKGIRRQSYFLSFSIKSSCFIRSFLTVSFAFDSLQLGKYLVVTNFLQSAPPNHGCQVQPYSLSSAVSQAAISSLMPTISTARAGSDTAVVTTKTETSSNNSNCAETLQVHQTQMLANAPLGGPQQQLPNGTIIATQQQQQQRHSAEQQQQQSQMHIHGNIFKVPLISATNF